MSIKLFITGTDTHIGKTHISVGLLNVYNQQGLTTLGCKPLASGCARDKNGMLINDDALALQQASSIKLPYELINPIAYEPAIAPHIAANMVASTLNVELLHEKMQTALNTSADVHIIEGVGGWYTPLNDNETMADWVRANNFQVILVVGVRLGCLNHALLTMHAMQKENIAVKGWIANCIDPEMQSRDENIETLKTWLPYPCLAVVEHGKTLISLDT